MLDRASIAPEAAMTLGTDLLYLSRDAIVTAKIDPAMVEAAVESAFRAKAIGAVANLPKTGFRPTAESAHFFAMPGAMPERRVAALKWVAVGNANREHDLPSISALILLNDIETGAPLAIMDGAWVTEVRTAAATAIAARALARPESRRVGFVACGQQARNHLAALRLYFPLTEVVAYSRRRATAEAFVRETAARGLDASVAETPRDAVTGMDIVVTSVPPEPGPHRFLDPAWLSRGGFASLVDLGRSWRPEGFAEIDRIITDDRRQSEEVAIATKLPYGGPFHAELGDILIGRASARHDPTERVMFLHAGIALTDVAVAALIHERAAAAGLGMRLAL